MLLGFSLVSHDLAASEAVLSDGKSGSLTVDTKLVEPLDVTNGNTVQVNNAKIRQIPYCTMYSCDLHHNVQFMRTVWRRLVSINSTL